MKQKLSNLRGNTSELPLAFNFFFVACEALKASLPENGFDKQADEPDAVFQSNQRHVLRNRWSLAAEAAVDTLTYPEQYRDKDVDTLDLDKPAPNDSHLASNENNPHWDTVAEDFFGDFFCDIQTLLCRNYP